MVSESCEECGRPCDKAACDECADLVDALNYWHEQIRHHESVALRHESTARGLAAGCWQRAEALGMAKVAWGQAEIARARLIWRREQLDARMNGGESKGAAA